MTLLFNTAALEKPCLKPAMWQQLLGHSPQQKLRRFQPLIVQINGLEPTIEQLTDHELSHRCREYREQLSKVADHPRQERELLDEILPDIYALVRESSRRVLGLRHHDVQLLGGCILHHGSIAEMQTGEGKTLVSTLPAFLNALTGKGVHAVTNNDYLARRDAELMGQVHRFLGLTVGLIQSDMNAEERRKNYLCDITYATNSELGFDYLRDNMAQDPKLLVQREPYYCIIDEVDSILIDEARTPLIISGKVQKPKQKYMQAALISSKLDRGHDGDNNEIEAYGDYEVDEKQRRCILTDQGYEKAEALLGVDDLYNPQNPWAHFILSALSAKELFKRDVDYIVKNNEVIIIDQGTGRTMPGRRWSNGQHQALEAKESVDIQDETETHASITYQNYFRLYQRIGGMTGTGKTEAEEFRETYGLEVLEVPTHRPSRRDDYDDQVYRTEQAKWDAVANEIQAIHEEGRPILIGTTNVEKSEQLSALLNKRGLPHKLLNAKPDLVEREAEVVAQAGRIGAITIATNMAGRGTDIILGGNSAYMARLKVREFLMPLLLRHDRPQPKQPSSDGSFYPCDLSAETTTALEELSSELPQALGNNRMSSLEIEELLSQAAEKAPTQNEVVLKLRQTIQKIKTDYNTVLQPEAQTVRAAGGLHVIGTERHDSRRIDNQLRGRAGRQGDPGSTRFFLSLEDKLMQLFGGKKLESLLIQCQSDEQQAIESKLLSKTLESAQNKVEGYFYDQRKQVNQYDEVMNMQRRAIYAERRRALLSQNSRAQVLNYGYLAVNMSIESLANPDLDSSEWDLESMLKYLRTFVPIAKDITASSLHNLSSDEIKILMCEQFYTAYKLKEEAIDQQRPGLMRQVERFFTLQQIDLLWREHLQSMNALKESVSLRSYAQKDPLIEFKNEGYELFLGMMDEIKVRIIRLMFTFKPKKESVQQAPKKQTQSQQEAQKTLLSSGKSFNF